MDRWELEELYWYKGYTQKDIGTIYDVSQRAIGRRMDKWNIETRHGGGLHENHPEYTPPVSDYGSKEWRKNKKKAKERDDYTCQVCGVEQNLVVHHLIAYKKIADKPNPHVLTNLITLCEQCHKEVHNKEGKLTNYKVR